MKIIKIIYDDGQNGLVELHRKAKKDKKRLCDMTTAELISTGCGLFVK